MNSTIVVFWSITLYQTTRHHIQWNYKLAIPFPVYCLMFLQLVSLKPPHKQHTTSHCCCRRLHCMESSQFEKPWCTLAGSSAWTQWKLMNDCSSYSTFWTCQVKTALWRISGQHICVCVCVILRRTVHCNVMLRHKFNWNTCLQPVSWIPPQLFYVVWLCLQHQQCW